MTLSRYLRVSPSSCIDVLPLGKAHPFILMGLLRTAPLFALAFEGALLPLSMHEPALSPLFALPRRIAPRTHGKGSACFNQKNKLLLCPTSQRATFNINLDCVYQERSALSGRSVATSWRCSLCSASTTRSGEHSEFRAERNREFTEDRAPERMGTRGGIVAIEHARAGIVAIVRIAQTNSTADAR